MQRVPLSLALLIAAAIALPVPVARADEQGGPSAATPSRPTHTSPGGKQTVAKPGAPQPVITVKDGRLTVQVQQWPLERVLEEISRHARVGIVRAPGVEGERVSVQFQELPVDEGLRRILTAHDAFFFYGGEEKAPTSLRAVWIYPRGGGRGLQPVPPETWASTMELEGRVADPDPGVRVRAVEALVERKGDQAGEAVLDALRDHDDQVRIRALYQALRAGVKLPTDALRDLALNDPSADVRLLALAALGGSPELRTIAETVLNDPNPRIQRTAQEILRGLDAPARPRQSNQASQHRSLQPKRR